MEPHETARSHVLNVGIDDDNFAGTVFAFMDESQKNAFLDLAAKMKTDALDSMPDVAPAQAGDAETNTATRGDQFFL